MIIYKIKQRNKEGMKSSEREANLLFNEVVNTVKTLFNLRNLAINTNTTHKEISLHEFIFSASK